MTRILVGFDGSPNAVGALRWAACIAEPLAAELIATSAWSPRQAELPPREADEEHRELDDENVDLIVVGLRGAGGFHGLALGSVADTLAHHTTRPVALVPSTPSLETRHIVLGVDGSEGASAATTWCAAFASGLKAEVTAANVYTQQFELLPEGRRTNALAIVVGTHGLAPLIHLRLGGVTMQLLHTTTVPVTIVPPPR